MENNTKALPIVQDEIRISDYIRIIIRFRYLVILIFVIAISITVYVTMRKPKIYSATTRILIEDQKGKTDLMFLSTPGLSKTTINNYMEIMRSKPLATLAWEIMKRDPNWQLFPMNQDTHPEGRIITGMKVESKRDTDILTISFSSTSPQEAMTAVNAIAEAQQQLITQHARLEFTTIREFLETQLDAISRRLQISENDLRDFKNKNRLAELSQETTKLIEKATEIESAYETAMTDKAIKLKTLEYLNAQLVKQDSLVVDISNITKTSYIEELRRQIVEKQAMVTSLVSKIDYSDSHRQIQMLEIELQDLKAKLDNEIQKLVRRATTNDPLASRSDIISRILSTSIDLEMANAKLEGLTQTKELYDERIITLPDTELELARIVRNVRLDEKIHSMMMEKYEDAKIAEQAKVGNVRILDTAGLPFTPISPKVTRDLLVGIVFGLALGIGAAFFVHSLDTKLRTLEDMENYVKLPVAGTIPLITESESRIEEYNRLIEHAEGENRDQLMKSMHFIMMQLVSHYAPKSPIAEAYRTLRTNIVSRKPAGSTTILITSAGPKEGKSTTAVNLAVTMAQMNNRVVLVDMDMRRPMIHTKFGIDKERGSSDYLIDPEIKLTEVTKPSGILNLDLITSGFVPPNPSELIASKRLDTMLEELKTHYDCILFDSPPIIAVTDALILTKKLDLTFIVVRAGFTEKGIVKRTKELMENIDAKIDGIIVNSIYAQSYYSKRSYYYYHYYYYYYYYGDEVPTKQKKGASRFLRKNQPFS